jgi:hypothetical protein
MFFSLQPIEDAPEFLCGVSSGAKRPKVSAVRQK